MADDTMKDEVTLLCVRAAQSVARPLPEDRVPVLGRDHVTLSFQAHVEIRFTDCTYGERWLVKGTFLEAHQNEPI